MPSAVPDATTAPAAFFTTTALPASALTEIACVVLVANPPVNVDVSLTTGATGAIVSTLMLTAPALEGFPAASVAVAVKVFTPCAKLLTFAVK